MTLIGTKMVSDGKTARQIFEEVMANPARKKFGFGEKLAIVNVDFQQAYTRMDMFATAYESDLRQIDYVNRLSRLARASWKARQGLNPLRAGVTVVAREAARCVVPMASCSEARCHPGSVTNLP